MPLQQQALSVASLSVLADAPPNGLQPKLADGIHLRWAFERARGFPWFGYYLYRRASNSADRSLRRADLAALPIGAGASTSVSGPNGTLSSDRPLAGTDDFAPAGTAEADLAGRAYLRFTPVDLASEVRLSIGFRQDAEVEVTAFLQQVPVATVRVKGTAGSVVPAVLAFDAITSLEVTPAAAALVDIGFLGATDHPLAGWQPVPGFPGKGSATPYPLCLPVAHVDYTCPGAPVASADADAMATARVRYALPPAWSTTTFTDLHAVLAALVDGGPAGPLTMAEKEQSVAPVPPDPRLTMPRQSPLDLLLLGALHPGIAQMIGLAWVDADAAKTPDTAFDYLLVADHTGVLGGEWQLGLDYLRTNGFDDVDAYIVSGKKVNDPSPVLDAPTDLRAYALPLGAPTSAVSAASAPNAAGLRWNRGVTALGVLLPGRPVMYHVWRASLGTGAAPSVSRAYDHRTVDGPLIVVDPDSASAQANAPQDWPPMRLYFVDAGLPDGWYAYQVNGVDLFGRHSANSTAAAWYQWTPMPTPSPWYYTQPAGNRAVHPSAIALLDKIGPPPPTAIEAWVLDPDDPLLVQDAAYDAWRAALPVNERSVTGLRVSWRWPQAHMDQAPDTREFRVYFHTGRRNTHVGNTTAVAAASATETTVDTDVPNTDAANAYVGARLQIGDASFRVTGSDGATPLRLRVANIGPGDTVRPAANAACSVVIPETIGTGSARQRHPLYTDFGASSSWDERHYVVPAGSFVSEDFVGLADSAGNALNGASATANGAEVTLDGPPDLAGAAIVGSYLRVDADSARADKLYRIIRADGASGLVTVDGAPAIGGGSSPWTIGRKERRYDVMLPAAGDAFRGGAPLAATVADPLVYGSIGVSAADDKTHTSDAVKWTAGRWGGAARYGNEGRVGAPVTIYHVYRGKPAAPDLPVYGDERLYASRADYHNRSYFTFRWIAAPGVKTHVFRALDDALFAADWLLRSTRGALSATESAHDRYFPPAWNAPTADVPRKQAAVAELNAIAGTNAYAALSADARTVLARLPGNEGQVWGEGLAEHDWEIRRTRTTLSAGDATLFPPDWNAGGAGNQQKRQDVVALLNGIASRAAYRSLTDNALRVLASLPGNERAFTQLTILPLDPDDPANTDRLGPDTADGYAPGATVRAYVDALDGRSSNRYFYRGLNVNAVQTRGTLGFAPPPVYCPDVMPPRTPVLTKALGGNREITLTWASNREPDLAAYLVYRSEDAGDARDIRRMTLVRTDPVSAAVAPDDRPASITWADQAVVAARTYWYRLAASDAAGNVSDAALPVCARAYDTTPPPPPAVLDATWHGRILRVRWTPRPGAEVRVERRAANEARFRAASDWVDGALGTADALGAEPRLGQVVRLRARTPGGNLSADGPTTTVAADRI